MKSERTKATDISKKVKDIVWERDSHRCILCGSPNAFPNGHFIPRSLGGKGIEENVVTLCFECHRRLDQSTERRELMELVREHLELWYPEFKDEDRYY